MVAERLALFAGFARANAERQGDVTQMALRIRRRREGEHVGGLVLLAEAGVQVADRGVVGQEDGDALPDRTFGEHRGVGGRLGQSFGFRDGGRPGRVLDLDVDHRPPRWRAASAS